MKVWMADVCLSTGEPDRLPVRPQVAISDHAAGFQAHAAILAALIARKKTGKGVHIDISMFDCQVGMSNKLFPR
jgi:crotonobetainyl-CoA:carnitine CoA-transferase CaiB-like acyl-CoA transferase